ncbi:MAG: DUF2849 domain-containing protein [Pseudomonadota bacterium]
MARIKPTSTVFLTANDLLSGAIVYWTGDSWSTDVKRARHVSGEAAQAGLEAVGKAEEAANTVVGAYFVALDPINTIPLELRERQRRAGPSIALPAS